MKLLRQFVLSILLIGLALSPLANTQPVHASKKPTTITFWHGMTGTRKAALDEMISSFNHSQSNYQVVASSQGDFGNLQKKITAAGKSKTLPTLSQTTYTNVPNYVKGNLVASFDPYFSAKELGGIYPAFLKETKYQGHYYSMPFSKSVRIMYYNKALLKENHLKVPTTWQEVQQDGKKLKAKGITAMAFDQSFISEMDALCKQAGYQMLSQNPKKNLANQKSIKATHVITDMLANKTATTAGTDIYGSKQFFNNKTLFYCGSSAAISTMETTAPKELKWSAAPLPSYQNKKAAPVAGNDFVMFKSASKKQKQGAAAFVKYMMAGKQTINWATKTGYVPLTKCAQKDAAYQKYLQEHPVSKAAVNSLKDGFQDPTYLGYESDLVNTQKTVDDMAVNGTKPEKALPQLVTKLKTSQKL